jgi:hypothetical protein
MRVVDLVKVVWWEMNMFIDEVLAPHLLLMPSFDEKSLGKGKFC